MFKRAATARQRFPPRAGFLHRRVACMVPAPRHPSAIDARIRREAIATHMSIIRPLKMMVLKLNEPEQHGQYDDRSWQSMRVGHYH